MPAKKILALTGDYAEDYEIMVPVQLLSMVGHIVHTVCPDKQAGDYTLTSVHDLELGLQTYYSIDGHRFTLNKTFSEVNEAEYDALFITGGGAPEYIRLNPRVIEIVQHFANNNKPIGTVGHGVQVLAAAGVLRGRKVTGYIACEPEVAISGGTYVKKDWGETNVDGNLVSCVAWSGHETFVAEFLKVLGTTIEL
ncbi:unnamed protein product [Blepharisma stoltei]|uniref:DJ-1/PfpI domain-containing protein n=1 Tax=Blepharisma stoltei TaxID=1481888 RepID=A0AAU9K8X7_9CILI|nr:unnamed protein product [Blepharisma stoltei]